MTECKNGCPAFQLDVEGEGPAFVLGVRPPFDYMIYLDMRLALSQESHVFFSMYAKNHYSHFLSFCLPVHVCACCVYRLSVPQCVPGLPRSDSVCSLAGSSLWRLWLVSTQAGEFTHTHVHTLTHTHMNTQASLTDIL